MKIFNKFSVNPRLDQRKSASKGFTLIEVVAVIGVLAITSGILLVNTRTTEVQLNLTQDTANVALLVLGDPLL